MLPVIDTYLSDTLILLEPPKKYKKPSKNRRLFSSERYCSLVNWIQAGPEGEAAEAQYSVASPSPSLANVPIQYSLIIKILDMFFYCKHYRRLQNIHY